MNSSAIRSTRLSRLPIVLLCGLTIFTPACKFRSSSRVEESTADISFKSDNTVPISNVRAQGDVSFCWAYSTTAMLETLHKTRTNQQVILSPEALGFYHYLNLLKAYIANSSSDDSIRAMAKAIELGTNEGNWFNDDVVMGALSLLNRYGVVPESAFAVKFRETDGKISFAPRAPASESDAKTIELSTTELFRYELADNLRYLLKTKGIGYLKGMSEPDLVQQMMLSRYNVNFASEPPQSFTYEGKTYSPQSFLTDFLLIDVNALVTKNISPNPAINSASYAISTDLSTFYADANSNLHAGIAMPIAVGISTNRLTNGTFTSAASNTKYIEMSQHQVELAKKQIAEFGAKNGAPKNTSDPYYSEYIKAKDFLDHFDAKGWNNDSGHAMLLVGPVKSTIQTGSDTDRLILKNSSGISIYGANDPLGLTSDGLYLIEQGYLKLSAQNYRVSYISPKTPGVAPFLATAGAQRPYTPAQGSNPKAGEVGSRYCDKIGACYPYCTNGSSVGGGFGWQPELGGPNGGSCRVPSADGASGPSITTVAPPSTTGKWCENGNGTCYPYCTNGSNTGGGFGWQPDLGGPNGGSCRSR